MKVLAKVLCVVSMVSVIAGCASKSDVYIPKVPPGVQALLLDYYDQSDNKVFMLAVDPSGEFAVGYDYGKATTKEAAKVAFEKCEASREASGIIGGSFIYAVNNKVVYKDTIASGQKNAAPAE